MIVIIIILILLLVINILVDIKYKKKSYEFFSKEWHTIPSCKYKITQLYLDILAKYKIPKTVSDKWELYIPCSYDDYEKELKYLKPNFYNQKIFMINNSYSLASKSDLWKYLVKKYGREESLKYVPLTYVLNNPNDMKLFNKEYDKNKIYIMKKNIQRQEGLLITNKYKDIINGKKDNYIIVQELLQNPYIIDGRKINLRVYVLLLCKYGKIDVYIHNNGFMYYTKVPYKNNSLDKWTNITTGYIEREVYQKNPLTHHDFRKYLDKIHEKGTSEKVFNDIYNTIVMTVKAFQGKLCNGNLNNNLTFQLFGADIALDNNLVPKIMEFNIGPNLATHDDRDKEVKYSVVEDIFKTIGLIPNKNNNFIHFNL